MTAVTVAVVVGGALFGTIAVPGWIGAALLGGGFGLGLCLLVLGLRPSHPRLSRVLAPPEPPSSTSDGHLVEEALADGIGPGAARVVRVAIPAARALHRAGLPGERMTGDLLVVGRSPVVHLSMVVTAGIGGALVPALGSVPLALAGVGSLPAWLWLLCGIIGALLPALQVRATAARRRDELRSGIGAVLDLTAIALAGGAGVEQALYGASGVGVGWAQDQLRAALNGARTTHTDPWVTLGRLGAELDVGELVELAATLTLAGTEGARVRASLTAKAAALRSHQHTGAEADAASASERMSLPVIGLFAGYLVFIGYPALAQVLAL